VCGHRRGLLWRLGKLEGGGGNCAVAGSDATQNPRIKLFEWRVKIRSTPAALVGYFTAANADDAIKRAIARDQRSAYAIQFGRAEGARDCHMIKGDPDINDGKASEAGKAYSLEVLGNAGKALRRSLM
jgi:hypothetical protein